MRITFVVLAGLVALLLPGTAAAVPPAHDDFANATAIDPSSGSYSDSVQIDEATVEGGEPGQCYYGNSQTVWYSITPSTSGLYRLSRSSSFYYQFAAAWEQTGSGLTGLSALGCATWAFGTNSTTFSAQAGTTYYIQAGASFSSSGSSAITLEFIAPPANDDFANATPVGSVPFSDSVDATAASIESGEPTPSCGYGQSAGSIWYAFSPSMTDSYSVQSPYSGIWPQVAVYTGSSLGSLTDLGCRVFGSTLTFRAEAGRTYYLQLGGVSGGRGTINLSITEAPDPVANFAWYPGDPSIFDNVGFSDYSYDPGGMGIQTRSWSFGDGATGSDCCPTHRYGADGSYEVVLTVTTSDGRSASLSRQIEVRTHDVAITKLQVPQSANMGQTRQVVVGLSNKRYGETVHVQLYKSGVGGFEYVGTLIQSVPVRGGGRTTDFRFSYTFTSADAALGKVTFKAVAYVVGARDALPADNEAVSLPTKVSR